MNYQWPYQATLDTLPADAYVTDIKLSLFSKLQHKPILAGIEMKISGVKNPITVKLDGLKAY